MKDEQKTIMRKNILLVVTMLILFMVTDLILLGIFGAGYLNGREFIGLKRAAAELESNQLTAPAGFDNTPVYFTTRDYWDHCTAWCMLEDVVVSAIFALYLNAVRKKRKKSGGKDAPFLWITHTCVKILLNINSTVLFMGILEYTRESLWRTATPDDPLFDWQLVLPADWYAAQQNSLHYGLIGLVAGFAVMLILQWLIRKAEAKRLSTPEKTEQGRRKKSAKAAAKKQNALADAAKKGGRRAEKAVEKIKLRFEKDEEKRYRKAEEADEEYAYPEIHLYRRSWGALFVLILISAVWAAFGFYKGSANMNTISLAGFSMQYSAIMKFLLPIVITLNEMLSRRESSDPARFVPAGPMRYTANSLLSVAVVCLSLVVFSEFGSIISILVVTVLIFLFLNTPSPRLTVFMILGTVASFAVPAWIVGKSSQQDIWALIWSVIAVAAIGVLLWVNLHARTNETPEAGLKRKNELLSYGLTFLIGLGGGMGIVFVENLIMQYLAASLDTQWTARNTTLTSSISLNGYFLGIPMHGAAAKALGCIMVVVLAIAAVVCAVYAFTMLGAGVLLTLGSGACLLLRGVSVQNTKLLRIKEYIVLIPEVILQAALFIGVAFLLAAAYIKSAERRREKRRETSDGNSGAKQSKSNPHRVKQHGGLSLVSWGFAILTAAGCTIGFSAFGKGFDGKTILQSFYLQAGNFTDDYEIPVDATSKRRTAVREFIADHTPDENGNVAANEELPAGEKPVVLDPNALDWSKIQEYFDYNVKVYGQTIPARAMRIIDRLCYSTKTEELKLVQRGLRDNMGFAPTENTVNISSLQNKNYLVWTYFDKASEETRALYFSDYKNKVLRDRFEFTYKKDANGNDDKESPLYVLYAHHITRGDIETSAKLQKKYCIDNTDSERLVLKSGYSFRNVDGTVYLMVTDDSGEEHFAELEESSGEKKIFADAGPETACSDYVLLTLSKLGVGNALPMIFLPYIVLVIITLILMISNNTLRQINTGLEGFLFVHRYVAGFFAISFIVQTLVIVCGVFGISLFSGLSLPLVAKGNFEMLVNGATVGLICGSIIVASETNTAKD